MTELQTTFEQQLSVLVAKSLSDAHGNPEQMGVMIERLSYGLALVIATAARGDKEGIEEFLMGVESYLANTTLSLVPLGKMMS